jgi:hypothetical protein
VRNPLAISSLVTDERFNISSPCNIREMRERMMEIKRTLKGFYPKAQGWPTSGGPPWGTKCTHKKNPERVPQNH